MFLQFLTKSKQNNIYLLYFTSIYPIISSYFFSNTYIPLYIKTISSYIDDFHSSSAYIFLNCMASLSISNRRLSLLIMQPKMLSCSQLRMLISRDSVRSSTCLSSSFPLPLLSLSLPQYLFSLCQIVSPISMNSRLEVAFLDTQQQLMLIIMFQIKDYTNQPLGVTNDQTRNSKSAREGADREGERKRKRWGGKTTYMTAACVAHF